MSLRNFHYILLPNHQIAEADLMTWAEWFETADRHVSETFTQLYWISTVFLGINHRFGSGPPVLFETMVFEREGYESSLIKSFIVHEDLECHRYSSWDDAEAGHEATVRRYLKMEADATARMIEREKEKHR
jgi:hypothetical protein